MGWQDRDYSRGSSGGGRGGGSDFMYKAATFFSMSFPIGTYLGVRVRVHILFIFFIAFRLLANMDAAMWVLRYSSLLFISVLLHEFGHCLACRSVGGRADDILMWPLGGLAFCAPPRRPWPEFVTVVWGPMVNVIIAAACYLFLTLAYPSLHLVTLNPVGMWGHDYDPGLPGVIADLFVVNYALLLFNLILVFYPFDGGRLVQIALWKFLGYTRSMVIATRIGMAGGVLVGLYGIATGRLLLFFIGLFGLAACYQQKKALDMETAAAGYGAGAEFDPGLYGAGPAPKPSRRAQRRVERAARKREKQRRAAAAIDAEVDRILAKVKAGGMHSLTEKEKATLKRATDEQKRAG